MAYKWKIAGEIWKVESIKDAWSQRYLICRKAHFEVQHHIGHDITAAIDLSEDKQPALLFKVKNLFLIYRMMDLDDDREANKIFDAV